jgi:cytidylate kinase
MNISTIRNITVSGRIGSGQTTLATGIATALGWKLLEGGALFEKIHEKLKLTEVQVASRPDDLDLQYEEHVKQMLKTENHHVIQSHLAGFDAQGIEGVYKILLVCEDTDGNDKKDIRIDRLVNRKKISIEEAKEEVRRREEGNLEKWRRLYANGDENWVYWDKKYYDLIISTYNHNQEQTLQLALDAIGFKK